MPQAPVIRPFSWLATIPQFLIYSGVLGVVYAITHSMDRAIFIGIPIVLCYSIGSRYVLPAAHRRGLRLTHQERFEEAMEAYQESFEFFTRNAWIDRYRSIFMMSPGTMSYREMALCNIAYCYLQMGNGDQAEAYYRRALEMAPENGIALSALRMIETLRKDPTETA